MLNFFLNKGGAGISISRQETVDRINPILKRQIEVNHGYNYALTHCSDEEAVAQFDQFQKTARADVGKLSETVLSSGGVAYNGTDLEPSNYHLGDRDNDILAALIDQEQALLDAIEGEAEVEHHIRTQAILLNVRTHAQERLNYLKTLDRKIQTRPARQDT